MKMKITLLVLWAAAFQTAATVPATAGRLVAKAPESVRIADPSGAYERPLPLPSQVRIAPLALGFLKMNTTGVNIRRRPSTSAPRLGYFRCRECEETDMLNTLRWENEKGEPPFEPYHPETDDIFAYPLSATAPAGWQAVDNGNAENYIGYVADKLVTRLTVEPISADKPLSGDLRNQILTFRSGKYAGLWVYTCEDAMEGSYLYFGKLVDGKVVFYGMCDMPARDYEADGPSELIRTAEGLCYGSNRVSTNEYGEECFDLRKLTADEFDLLYSEAYPIEGQLYIVRAGGKEHVMQTWREQ